MDEHKDNQSDLHRLDLKVTDARREGDTYTLIGALTERGITRRRLGMFEGAWEDLEEAKALERRPLVPSVELAELAFESGNAYEAVRLITEVIDKDWLHKKTRSQALFIRMRAKYLLLLAWYAEDQDEALLLWTGARDDSQNAARCRVSGDADVIHNDQRATGELLTEVAYKAALLKFVDLARTAFDVALNYCRHAPDNDLLRRQQSVTLYLRGLVEHHAGEDELAAELWKEGLSIAATYPNDEKMRAQAHKLRERLAWSEAWATRSSPTETDDVETYVRLILERWGAAGKIPTSVAEEVIPVSASDLTYGSMLATIRETARRSEWPSPLKAAIVGMFDLLGRASWLEADKPAEKPFPCSMPEVDVKRGLQHAASLLHEHDQLTEAWRANWLGHFLGNLIGYADHPGFHLRNAQLLRDAQGAGLELTEPTSIAKEVGAKSVYQEWPKDWVGWFRLMLETIDAMPGSKGRRNWLKRAKSFVETCNTAELFPELAASAKHLEQQKRTILPDLQAPRELIERRVALELARLDARQRDNSLEHFKNLFDVWQKNDLSRLRNMLVEAFTGLPSFEASQSARLQWFGRWLESRIIRWLLLDPSFAEIYDWAFEDAVGRLPPTTAVQLYRLIDHLRRRGQLNEALRAATLLENRLEQTDSPDLWIRYIAIRKAELLQRLGLVEEAHHYVNRAIGKAYLLCEMDHRKRSSLLGNVAALNNTLLSWYSRRAGDRAGRLAYDLIEKNFELAPQVNARARTYIYNNAVKHHQFAGYTDLEADGFSILAEDSAHAERRQAERDKKFWDSDSLQATYGERMHLLLDRAQQREAGSAARADAIVAALSTLKLWSRNLGDRDVSVHFIEAVQRLLSLQGMTARTMDLAARILREFVSVAPANDTEVTRAKLLNALRFYFEAAKHDESAWKDAVEFCAQVRTTTHVSSLQHEYLDLLFSMVALCQSASAASEAGDCAKAWVEALLRRLKSLTEYEIGLTINSGTWKKIQEVVQALIQAGELRLAAETYGALFDLWWCAPPLNRSTDPGVVQILAALTDVRIRLELLLAQGSDQALNDDDLNDDDLLASEQAALRRKYQELMQKLPNDQKAQLTHRYEQLQLEDLAAGLDDETCVLLAVTSAENPGWLMVTKRAGSPNVQFLTWGTDHRPVTELDGAWRNLLNGESFRGDAVDEPRASWLPAYENSLRELGAQLFSSELIGPDSRVKHLLLVAPTLEGILWDELQVQPAYHRLADIVAVESVSVSLRGLAQAAKRDSRSGIIVGLANPATDLAKLPGTVHEIKALKELENAEARVYPFEDTAANPDCLKRPELKNCELLYFGCHAEVIETHDNTAPIIVFRLASTDSESAERARDKRDEQAKIATVRAVRRTSGRAEAADNGVFPMAGFATLPLGNTELVILSCCHTGRATGLKGPGVFGLAQSLALSGARAVLAHRWAADDLMASEFITRFLSIWWDNRETLSLYQVFREAQQQLLQDEMKKGGEGRTHPYYWAGWTLIRLRA